MVNGIVIPADDSKHLTMREFTSSDDYSNVVGGLLEAVDLSDLTASMFVNEEGIPRGLPFNARATWLWWIWQPRARRSSLLLGDAILVGDTGPDGETLTVPPAAATLLMEHDHYRIEVTTVQDDGWYTNERRFDDYFQAAAWGLMLLERWSLAVDVRVVPVLA